MIEDPNSRQQQLKNQEVEKKEENIEFCSWPLGVKGTLSRSELYEEED